jgi:DNA repair exonuclease SbcCD ATPase subunit
MKNFNEKIGRDGKKKEFSQADYKALSEIKKLLKAKNFDEAVEKLQGFESEIKQRIKKRQKELINKYSEEKGVFSKEEVIQKDIAIKIVNTVCKTDSDKNVIQIIRENEELKKENQKLREENAELKQKLLKAKEKFEELKIKANQILKAKVSYFKELYEKTRAELENFYQKESRPYTKLNEREKEVEKQIERKHKINPNKTYTIDF